MSSLFFTGRQAELSALRELISRTQCRLVNIIGPGGIGKTVLALNAFSEWQHSATVEQYVCYLQAVKSLDELAIAISDSLRIPLSRPETAEKQLPELLRDRNLVLLLDNFEQLVDEGGASYLDHVLETAPDVKIVTTSRRALNSRYEWRFPLAGLTVPPEKADPTEGSYGSVELFQQHAMRQMPGFDLVKSWADVVQICRELQGMPLALELAATWTKALNSHEILDTIKANPSAISTSIEGVQENKLGFICEQTWLRLTVAEQIAFAKLSLFGDGFEWQAAAHVAEIPLSLYTSLMDKALLLIDAAGRPKIHEFLRQFAYKRLVAEPALFELAARRHCRYYARFLKERAEGIFGGHQAPFLSDIQREIGNIRQAWTYACRSEFYTELSHMAPCLTLFYQMKGRFREGAECIEEALQAVVGSREDPQALEAQLYLLAHQGWSNIRLGNYALAEEVLNECLEIVGETDAKVTNGHGNDPLLPLAILSSIASKWDAALKLGHRAVENARENDQKWNLSLAHYVLSSAYAGIGEPLAAEQHASQALILAQQNEDLWVSSYCLNELGQFARRDGQLVSARQYFEQSLSYSQTLGSREGVAIANFHLGEIALAERAYRRAQETFAQSASEFAVLGDRGGQLRTLLGLGQAELTLGLIGSGASHLAEALLLATDIQFVPQQHKSIRLSAKLFIQLEQPEYAGQILNALLDQPALSAEERAVCDALAEAITVSSAASGNWQTVLAQTHTRLLAISQDAINPAQNLLEIEPLSERESELLALVADGLSNQQISERLFITVGTVKSHLHHIYSKLAVNSRTKAVAKARQLDLL